MAHVPRLRRLVVCDRAPPRAPGGCRDCHGSLPDRPETAMLRVRAEMLWTDARRSAMGRGRAHSNITNASITRSDLGTRPRSGALPPFGAVTLWVGSLDTVDIRQPTPHRRGVGPSCGWASPSGPVPLLGVHMPTPERLVDDVATLALRATLAHGDGRLEDACTPGPQGAGPSRPLTIDAGALSSLAARLTLATVRRGAQPARRRRAAAHRRPQRLSAHGGDSLGQPRSSASRSSWSRLEAATSTCSHRILQLRRPPGRRRPASNASGASSISWSSGAG